MAIPEHGTVAHYLHSRHPDIWGVVEGEEFVVLKGVGHKPGSRWAMQPSISCGWRRVVVPLNKLPDDICVLLAKRALLGEGGG